MTRPAPRLRLVFTLQLHVAVGAGSLRLRWQKVMGGAAGRILWVGPFGIGVHVIAKDASQDEPSR